MRQGEPDWSNGVLECWSDGEAEAAGASERGADPDWRRGSLEDANCGSTRGYPRFGAVWRGLWSGVLGIETWCEK